ncbi:hypothetical protein KIH39_00020 [Telmatocola sphagniphila]|uniref:Uncharacterized protein n=1 Tax=Telmatocola sphagniphila TaxID=1123043 RepID=A0A8E6B571_9BACT|nr:hypothetical protein [Telmatocola sphagniphila]QVL32340.1 hypothetical protein KIH39_00020 [Telmatocola sphagniphila]
MSESVIKIGSEPAEAREQGHLDLAKMTKAELTEYISKLQAENKQLATKASQAEAAAESAPRVAGDGILRLWRVAVEHAPELQVEAVDEANAKEAYMTELGMISTANKFTVKLVGIAPPEPVKPKVPETPTSES